jgi:hypothetical protein
VTEQEVADWVTVDVTVSVTVVGALVSDWVTVEVTVRVTVVGALVAGGVQRQVPEVDEDLQGSHQVVGNEVAVEQG